MSVLRKVTLDAVYWLIPQHPIIISLTLLHHIKKTIKDTKTHLQTIFKWNVPIYFKVKPSGDNNYDVMLEEKWIYINISSVAVVNVSAQTWPQTQISSDLGKLLTVAYADDPSAVRSLSQMSTTSTPIHL